MARLYAQLPSRIGIRRPFRFHVGLPTELRTRASSSSVKPRSAASRIFMPVAIGTLPRILDHLRKGGFGTAAAGAASLKLKPYGRGADDHALWI
jgi:hypothetical protein